MTVATVLSPDAVLADALRSVLRNAGVLVAQPTDVLGVDDEHAVVIAAEPDAPLWRILGSSRCPVLLVTNEVLDSSALVAAVGRGVVGIVSIDAEPEALVGSVLSIARGEAALSPATTRQLLDRMARRDNGVPVELSQREVEVLRAIAGGCSVKETAATLGISPRTVDNVQRFLYRKLGVHTRAQAVARAHELALSLPESASSRTPAGLGPSKGSPRD